jgi:hypothetical protein
LTAALVPPASTPQRINVFGQSNMNTFELIYIPPESSSVSVQGAIAKLLQQRDKQRFHHHHLPVAGPGVIEVQTLPPRHTHFRHGLQITISPAALTYGRGAFSVFAGAALVKPLLGELSRAVRACLDLDEEDCEDIQVHQLTLLRATMEVCFHLESELVATATLMDLAHHLKIVKDFAQPMPSKSWKVPRRQPSRVQWCENHKSVVCVELDFATVRAYLGDTDRALSMFTTSLEEGTEDAKALARRILCVEITADVSDAADPTDPTATLPVKLDRWFPDVLKINPYAFIWNAFVWDCWLNEDFSNADTNFDAAALSEEQRELLDHYLRGSSYRHNPVVHDSHERLLAFRRALINKAGVDLINPWRSFRLNRAQALRPLLTFDSRFRPESHPVLRSRTLTTADAQDRGFTLDAAAMAKPVRGARESA